MFLYPIIPIFPRINDKPPTVYSILESVVNFDREEKIKIKDLAKYGRTTIFDFDYPLSTKVNKEDFEVLILNKFMMRRIGYETVTAFQIALNVKLNEIMPLYNKMFDAIDGWDLFDDSETTSRVKTFNGESNGSSTVNNTTGTTSESTSDRRNSELPQNELSNIQDGNYMTDYNYDQDSGSSTSESESTSENTNTDSNREEETVTKTNKNSIENIESYKNFLESKQNVYTLIFKDLDELFYQLV